MNKISKNIKNIKKSVDTSIVTNKNIFDNISEAKPLTQQELRKFVDLATSSLAQSMFVLPNSKQKLKDKEPRLVILSISEPHIIAKIFYAHEPGIEKAFKKVINEALGYYKSFNNQMKFKIEIVTSCIKHANYQDNLKFNLNSGIEGLAFASNNATYKLLLLPEQIASNALLTPTGELDINGIYHYLENQPSESVVFSQIMSKKTIRLYKIRTKSYYFDHEHNEAINLYRGQLPFESFTAKELKNSIELAGNYLLNVIDEQGRFDYQYRADLDRSIKDYNFLRHAGTCFSILEYIELSGNHFGIEKLKKAMEYMKLYACPGLEDPKKTTCFVQRGLAKLGGNGLSALALAKYMKVTSDMSEEDLLRRVCSWIVLQTQEDGNFRGHKQYYGTGNYASKTVLYYPGEVIYGLVSSYHLFKENVWIETASRIAKWLINVRDLGVQESSLEHDHWLLYGLNELHRIAPEKIYIEHSKKICRAIMSCQFTENKQPDFIGAHNKKQDPSSTQAATRCEGLLAAYRLLSNYDKDLSFTSKVFEYAKRSLCFQLRTQYTDVNSFYLPDKMRALGGFRQSLFTHDIRIDYVQHNLSSLIQMYKLIKT